MKFLKSKYLKPFTNIYILTIVVFAVWMLFFDNNSYVIHRELNKEIDALNDEKEYYKKEIENDQNEINKLSSEDGLESFAREAYYMKRDNEDIYIIEYEDSLKTTTNE